MSKSGLSEEEFDLFLAIISSKIEFIPYSDIENFTAEAEKISPDINDTEYFSLALKLKCGIWTRDKKLKSQNIVKIYSTEDLINELKEL